MPEFQIDHFFSGPETRKFYELAVLRQPTEALMLNRRHFLKNTALISFTPAIPAFLTKTTLGATEDKTDGRILVVIQLSGGNDGINTVVPFKDEGYPKHRTGLRLPEKDLIKLTDEMAFHPRLRSASELFQDGRLSVVHGVGYPNPNRSHFESMGIWHAASTAKEDRELGNGWLGDAISLRTPSNGPHAIHVGDEDLPVALRGRRCTAITASSPADLQLTLSELAARDPPKANSTNLSEFVTKSVNNAYASAKELADSMKEDSGAQYPGSKLGKRLKLVGQLIKSSAAAPVYYTSQSGYDTHAAQLPAHGNLLGELSSSLKAFMNDMKQSGLEERVLVMAFSEFGRRVKENDSIGTDHGTAGPVFLAGTSLARRLYGQKPSLLDLDSGDLKYSMDFRNLYAAILVDWLHLSLPRSLSGFGMEQLLTA